MYVRTLPVVRCAVSGVLLVAAAAPSARAQSVAAPTDLPVLTAEWDSARAQPREPLLVFRLTRPLTANEGRLAVVIGRSDVSALVDLRGRRVLLPLRGERLPDGEVRVEAYLVSTDGAWRKLGSFLLHRLTRGGFESASVRPRLDAQSDGQLDAKSSAGGSPAGRGTPWQDLTWNGGVDFSARRGGWENAVQALVVGVPREQARLRASQLGPTAPVVDLASYNVRLTHGAMALSAGHIAVGTDRLLASQFRSRGVSADVGLGRMARLALASVAGSEIVGWGDPVGLGRPSHRVQSATLGIEALPARPGLLHVDLSAIDGSLQPIAAFTQQSVTDRETSRGVGVSVVAALPSQRLRLAAGTAQSRFDNPRDPLLAGESSIVPVKAETRHARYADVTLDVLRGRSLLHVNTSLQVTARQQRTDPLYRSVAASVQADQQQDALEVTASFGVLQVQATAIRGRDNLAGVPTLLVTRSRAQTVNASLPVAALLKAAPTAWWWPSLSLVWQGSGQRGDALPDSAGFRFAFQRPDQWNANTTVSATWQRALWNVTWRTNRSLVDNRQAGHDRSDFRTTVNAITIGATPSPKLSIGLDVADERGVSVEPGTRALTRRAAAQGDWRPFAFTSIGGAYSITTTDDDAATRRGRNDEMRVELSQGLNLYRRATDGAQLRGFLRYARSNAAARLAGALQPGAKEWTISAGLNLRFL